MIQSLLALKERLVRIEVFACGLLLIVMTLVISYGMFERFVIRHGVAVTLRKYLGNLLRGKSWHCPWCPCGS